jgi:transcriptional regulator with XRE-family HTH domain
MDDDSTLLNRRAGEATRPFGRLIRSRRKALHMTQDQLALATGVGRRFLIDLEAGKATCQLGLSLVVAEALGIRSTEPSNPAQTTSPSVSLELPCPLDEELEHETDIHG